MTSGEIVTARHIVIRGGVQGVGFRWFAREEAGRLGVAGWIRNSGDGSVEAVIEGTDAALEAMLAWLRVGPPAASVTAVDVTDAVPSGSRGFRIDR
ncbi:acylphosphatase [Leifsonia sp. Leaf264]|uniref:acylphosphatase n=1 Tax=Leifsonia sp. Leaf264 TaxID=1736314 RepID=UPI0006FD6050|nr:acylphosphatase [Leifsonia sp. Leaf264]KQP01675.1 acylphosphatase [Leifsonia sp. Leaf264]